MLQLIRSSFLLVGLAFSVLTAADRAEWAKVCRFMWDKSSKAQESFPGYDATVWKEALRKAAEGQAEPWARLMAGGENPDEGAETEAKITGLLIRAWIAPELPDPSVAEVEALLGNSQIGRPHRTMLHLYLYHMTGNDAQATLAFRGEASGDAIQYIIVTGRGAAPLAAALRELTADAILGKEIPQNSVLNEPVVFFNTMASLPEATSLPLLRSYVLLAGEANRASLSEAILEQTAKTQDASVLKLRGALLRLIAASSSRPSGEVFMPPVERWYKERKLSGAELMAYRKWLLPMVPPALPQDALGQQQVR